MLSVCNENNGQVKLACSEIPLRLSMVSPLKDLVDCSQSPISLKIVEIERFALRAAILHECQNYLGVGAVWEEARNIFLAPLPLEL